MQTGVSIHRITRNDRGGQWAPGDRVESSADSYVGGGYV